MLGKYDAKASTDASPKQSKGWRLPDRLGEHQKTVTAHAGRVTIYEKILLPLATASD